MIELPESGPNVRKIREVLNTGDCYNLDEVFVWDTAPQRHEFWARMCTKINYRTEGFRSLSYSAEAYLRWVIFCIENDYEPGANN